MDELKLDRESLAAIGRAQRSHLENQMRILEGVCTLVGRPLAQVSLQQQGIDQMADAPDWVLGLSLVEHLLESESEELLRLATPGTIQ